MKRVGRIVICLAGGLALNAGLRAADPAELQVAASKKLQLALNAGAGAADPASVNNPSPDNPYAAVVVRNIFGLVATPPPPDPNIKIEASLPKITPTGIMSVFGHSRVLFKVAGAPAKQGQPAKDEFYILSQGQRQDDIEVTKIDEKNSLVTFDNHGTTQELPLINTPAPNGPAASPSSGAGNPAMVPGLPGGVGNSGPGGIIQFGAGSGGRNGSGGRDGSGSGVGGGGAGGANGGLPLGDSTQGRIYQPEASTMTPEQSQAMIVLQHLNAINNNDRTAPLFPPTAVDKEAGITGPDDGGPPGP
jgi:uncharacterized membrane protein YgcG